MCRIRLDLAAIGADPAILGNIEDDAFWVLELALKIAFPLVAQVEEELAAIGLDHRLGLLHVVDLNAKMVRPGLTFRLVAEVVPLAALEIQERKIDRAIPHIDRRTDRDIFAAVSLQPKDRIVELSRFV